MVRGERPDGIGHRPALQCLLDLVLARRLLGGSLQRLPADLGRLARRARWASMTRCRATVHSHARAGPRAGSNAAGCCHARSSVSCTTSSAHCQSPEVSRST